MNSAGKVICKYIKRILEVNNTSSSQLRVHLNLSDLCRAARKKFSLIDLYKKERINYSKILWN